MREILWTDSAKSEFRDSTIYLVERNPEAAKRFRDLIIKTVENLADTPTGRRGRVSGTYEKVIQGYPYIIAYALDNSPTYSERLVILGIIHTSRNWPDDAWPAGHN